LTVTAFIECPGQPESPPECFTLPFEIKAGLDVGNPWGHDQDISIDPDGSQRMHLEFNPANVCDIADCNAIYLIQVARLIGYVGSGSRIILPSEFQLAEDVTDRHKIDATMTPQGHFVDQPFFALDPFMNGRDSRTDDGHPGRSGGNPATSTASDPPSLTVLAGLDSLHADFEVDAFCNSGDGRGTWLGRTYWYYRRAQGEAIGTVGQDPAHSGPDRQAADAEFKTAVALFMQERRGLQLVEPLPPKKRSPPCN
jgi:hypothetical protein